jgi:hypothetical protein
MRMMKTTRNLRAAVVHVPERSIPAMMILNKIPPTKSSARRRFTKIQKPELFESKTRNVVPLKTSAERTF